MQFLLSNAFTVPQFMVNTDVLRRIQPIGAVDRVRTAQTAVLTSLLQNQRLDRMTEQLTIDGATIAYAPLQFLTDVRTGVWSELGKPGTAITIYRRNLQRAYLDNMDQKLNGTPAASAEIRMLVKGELQALDRQLQTAAAAPGLDENTRRHLADSRDEIAIILDPRVPRPAPDPAAAAAALAADEEGCDEANSEVRKSQECSMSRNGPLVTWALAIGVRRGVCRRRVDAGDLTRCTASCCSADPAIDGQRGGGAGGGQGQGGGQGGGQGAAAARGRTPKSSPRRRKPTTASSRCIASPRARATACSTRSRRTSWTRTSSGTPSSRRRRSAPATAASRSSAAASCAGC